MPSQMPSLLTHSPPHPSQPPHPAPPLNPPHPLSVISASNALLSELAIVIFDSTSGGVEIYRGMHYPDPATAPASATESAAESAAEGGGSSRFTEEQQRANLLCIKFVPGHYQALVAPPEALAAAGGGAAGPTLSEALRCFDLHGVAYVLTDG